MPTSKKRKEQRKLLNQSAASTATASGADADTTMDLDDVDGSSSSASEPEIVKYAKIRPKGLNLNPDVQMRGVEEMGRGLFWCPASGRTLPKGSTILRLQPEMLVPNDNFVQHVCHVCWCAGAKDWEEIECCPDCKLIRYCSDSCKEADKAVHQYECKALISLNARNGNRDCPADPSMIVRLMARTIWKRGQIEEKWWKNIESLLAHPEERQFMDAFLDPEERDALLKFRQQTIDRLADYLIGSSSTAEGKDADLARLGYPSMKELGDLFNRNNYNDFDARLSNHITAGHTLCTVAAMMNHSCGDSNASIVWPNGPGAIEPMHIVAMRDIKAGEEILGCYIDPTLPCALRQARLRQTYLFNCACKTCTNEQQALQESPASVVNPREALTCGRSGCDGWVPLDSEENKARGVCMKCNQPCYWTEDMVERTLFMAKALLNLLETENDPLGNLKYVQQSWQLFKMLTAIQPPCSYPLSSLLRQVLTMFTGWSTMEARKGNVIEAAKYREEAIQFGLTFIAGLKAGGIITEGDPVRMTMIAQVAVLLIKEINADDLKWVKQNGAKSQYLHRAYKIPEPTNDYYSSPRMDYGLKLLEEAAKEIKIGFGDDSEHCEMHRNLKKAAKNWANPDVNIGFLGFIEVTK